MPKLKLIDENSVIYARKEGGHFHLDLNCVMLLNGQFVAYGYAIIKKKDIKKRHLIPCICAYDDYKVPLFTTTNLT